MKPSTSLRPPPPSYSYSYDELEDEVLEPPATLPDTPPVPPIAPPTPITPLDADPPSSKMPDPPLDEEDEDEEDEEPVWVLMMVEVMLTDDVKFLPASDAPPTPAWAGDRLLSANQVQRSRHARHCCVQMLSLEKILSTTISQ